MAGPTSHVHRGQRRWRELAARSPVSATPLKVLAFAIVLLIVIAIATDAAARVRYEDVNDNATKEAAIISHNPASQPMKEIEMDMTQKTSRQRKRNGNYAKKKVKNKRQKKRSFQIDIVGNGTAFQCELKPLSTEPPPTREGQYMIHAYGWPHSGTGFLRETINDAIQSASLGSVSMQDGKCVPGIVAIQNEGQFMQKVRVVNSQSIRDWTRFLTY